MMALGTEIIFLLKFEQTIQIVNICKLGKHAGSIV